MAEIQMGNLLFVFEVTVANLSNEGIIGLDFLTQTQSVLDCRRLELQMPWKTTMLSKDHIIPSGITVCTHYLGGG